MKRSFAAQQRLKRWNRKQTGKLRAQYCARSHLPKPTNGVTEEQLAEVLDARRRRQRGKTS